MLKRSLSLFVALLVLCAMPVCALATEDLILIEDSDTASAEYENTEQAVDGQTAHTLPDWYPENINSFEPFNDPEADRVVDNADIFSATEEKEMRELIAEISAASGKDIVILTDTSSYGVEHRVFAADFYDFNGYGMGDSHDGIIIFICMDPMDRDWQTVTTGSAIAVYTERVANKLDDALFEYLSEGRYAEGVTDWIYNVGALYSGEMSLDTSGNAVSHAPFVDYEQSRATQNTWVDRGIFCAMVGAVVGLVSLVIAWSRMKRVSKASTAEGNLVENSVKIRSNDRLINVTVSKTYSPVERDNNNRSGGSSFGGFKGSSGTSHGGSGRKF